MLIVSSNVKGLGCPRKRSHIRAFLKIYYIDIVLLQETKIAFPLDSFLRYIGGPFITGWSHLNSLRASEGSLLGGGRMSLTVLANRSQLK